MPDFRPRTCTPDECDRRIKAARARASGRKQRIETARIKYMEKLDNYKSDVGKFDWFYEMSDSHDVWQRGHSAEQQLLSRACIGGDDFKRAWNEAHALRYNTKTFCGPYRAPFPDVWPANASDNTYKSK